ncbi:MAG: alpha/beta fold hydrolase [Pseudomonadota bacterium]
MLRFLLRLLLILVLLAAVALAGFRILADRRETADLSAAPATGSFIETQSTSFFAQAAGPAEATPVLLAHGTAAWSGFWSREVTYLASKGYNAIAFDMPPFGYSERPANGDYSRPAQAKRILDLARAQPRPPIMVAHSFGAAAATEAVLRDPRSFAGLIIVNGAIGMGTKPPADLPLPLRPRTLREAALAATATNPLATKVLLRQLIHRKEAATDPLVSVLQTPQRRQGTTPAYADWLPSLLAPTPTSLSLDPVHYANLPIPVRIIWGDKDTVTPPEQAEALAEAFGDIDVRYLKDVGHIPHIEAPEEFAALLLELLREMD